MKKYDGENVVPTFAMASLATYLPVSLAVISLGEPETPTSVSGSPIASIPAKPLSLVTYPSGTNIPPFDVQPIIGAVPKFSFAPLTSSS